VNLKRRLVKLEQATPAKVGPRSIVVVGIGYEPSSGAWEAKNALLLATHASESKKISRQASEPEADFNSRIDALILQSSASTSR
jgi:hypothetical protein